MTDGKANSAAQAGRILTRDGHTAIAYDSFPGKQPTVVFLHGFRSDRKGGKAMAVDAFCRDRGQACLRLDVSGHGESGGAFEDGCIGDWATDVVDAIDHLTQGPLVLVGSSMGGWLMLLAALQRRQRVAGLLGLAAAPDFTEELIYQAFTGEQKQALLREGRVMIDESDGLPPCPVTRRLIEDGRNQLLLHSPINLTCPVRLIHGQRDTEVPWSTALRLAEQLNSEDVRVTLVKNAGHRLSEPADLDLMLSVLEDLLRTIEAAA